MSGPQPGASPAGSGRVAAWLVLAGMGGTGLVYNIWHATHAGHLALGLALLYGVAPVAAAMGLSHIAGACRGGWLMQAITVCVMLGAMALSVGATAAVVAPVAPGVLRYVFPAVMDAAALVGLRVILTPRAAGGAARAGAGGEAEAARELARQAGAERDAAVAERDAAVRDARRAAAAADVALRAVSGATWPGSGPATSGTSQGHDGGHQERHDGSHDGSHDGGHDGAAAPGSDPGGAAAGGRPGRVLAFAPHPGNGTGAPGSKRGQTRQVMRDHWDSELAHGRIPNGAQLNRAAGKDPDYSLGKRYAQQWRQEIAGETPRETPGEMPGEGLMEWRGDAVAGQGARVLAGEGAR